MCCFSLISESIVELKKKSGGDADVKTDSNKRIKNKTEVIAQSKLLQRNQAVVRNSEVRKWRATCRAAARLVGERLSPNPFQKRTLEVKNYRTRKETNQKDKTVLLLFQSERTGTKTH